MKPLHEQGKPVKRFYRPELDIVRLCAFLCVFVHHLSSRLPGSVSSFWLSVENCLGFGLCLFFTLSAYLITVLLLKERKSAGEIALVKFYQRRMLRIWPLYLLTLLFGVVVAVALHKFRVSWPWFVAALFMAGNLVKMPATIVGHMWSISVEEQFYLIWPGLMKQVGRRALFIAAGSMIAVSNIVLVRYGLIHADTDSRIWENSFVQFQMFASGILLALIQPQEMSSLWNRFLALCFLPVAWFVASAVCRIKEVGGAASGPVSLCIGYALVSVSCGLFIWGISGLQHWPKWMIYLGKISYGLYVFHAPAIHIFERFPLSLKVAGAISLTIASAMLSYKYFETPFLKLKERLEIVHSRPVATE